MTDPQPMLRAAASAFNDVVRAIDPVQLASPTPCAEYDVRALVNHLLYWGPWLEAAARRQPAPSVAGGEREVDLTDGDWASALEKLVDALLDAFARPGAFAGMTTMGSAELPASMIADMVLAEWVLHGWDLAAATGGTLRCAPEVAEAVHTAVAAMAEQARG
jgi:uncharacterized protein (TIGR03086 family)